MAQEINVKKYKIEGSDRLFDNKEDAEREEKLLQQKSEIMPLLGGKIDISGFTGGEGKVRISEKNYVLAKKLFGDMIEEQFGEREVHPRWLDDWHVSRIPNNIRYIFDCIFEENGFYYRVGQPYYAINPNKLYSSDIIKEAI